MTDFETYLTALFNSEWMPGTYPKPYIFSNDNAWKDDSKDYIRVTCEAEEIPYGNTTWDEIFSITLEIGTLASTTGVL